MMPPGIHYTRFIVGWNPDAAAKNEARDEQKRETVGDWAKELITRVKFYDYSSQRGTDRRLAKMCLGSLLISTIGHCFLGTKTHIFWPSCLPCQVTPKGWNRFRRFAARAIYNEVLLVAGEFTTYLFTLEVLCVQWAAVSYSKRLAQYAQFSILILR